MSHKKFGPDRFSRFDVYWIQTNKQTDKPNLYIDKESVRKINSNRMMAVQYTGQLSGDTDGDKWEFWWKSWTRDTDI